MTARRGPGRIAPAAARSRPSVYLTAPRLRSPSPGFIAALTSQNPPHRPATPSYPHDPLDPPAPEHPVRLGRVVQHDRLPRRHRLLHRLERHPEPP